MLLSDLLDIDKLRMEIIANTISVRAHPLDPNLRIYNYTHAAAYEGVWTHEQRVCRGLIVRHPWGDAEGELVARPFKKFWNYGEHLMGHEDIPLHEPFTVTSKEDGSLGILYQAPDGPAIATRGSFESEQALWATAHLRASGAPSGRSEGNVARLFGSGVTVLFEIVFPANRIVLDYGGYEGLIHLATLDTETGRPVEEHQWAGRRTSTLPFAKLEDVLAYVKSSPAENREGFVIYFPESDLRVKVKFEEYVKLHRILTGLSERRIWEHISQGGKIEDFIDGVPDEFYSWVREVDQRLRMQHDMAMNGLSMKAEVLHEKNFPSRRDLALFIKDEPDKGYLFRAYDGQWGRLSEQIWKDLRPVGNITFRDDDDS